MQYCIWLQIRLCCGRTAAQRLGFHRCNSPKAYTMSYGSSCRGPVEQLRTTGNHAIDSLQQIAKELGKTDASTRGEFAMLLREMPRFELATLPEEITLGRWKILGDRIVRFRIKDSLQESVGSLLKKELHLYDSALSQWGEQIVRKLETLVNSYANGYRVQIQRISRTLDEVVDVGKLQSDLDLLRNWNATSMADFAEKLA
jgi:hypothetical protein